MANKKWEEREPRPTEYWRDVPGYGGEFQASTEGRVRRRTPEGGWTQLRINENTGGRKVYYTVWLKTPEGKWRERSLLRVIAMTWWPEKYRADLDVVHRNGLHADNSAYNVLFVSRADRMRRQCLGRNRRAVFHIDTRQGGKILDIYPSVAAAAKAVGLTGSTVCQHCRGIHTVRPDGTTFRYADKEMGGRTKRGGT